MPTPATTSPGNHPCGVLGRRRSATLPLWVLNTWLCKDNPGGGVDLPEPAPDS